MQANTQDLSVMLGPLMQGPATGVAALGKTQPSGIKGEVLGGDFLASLESSLQALAQGEQSPLVPFDPAQMLAAIEQYLGGQGQLPPGNGLPLAGGIAGGDATALTADLNELVTRLHSLLNGAPGAAAALAPQQTPAAAPALALVMTPVAADKGMQAQLEQRRLFERFQTLPEVRQVAGELSASALQQALGRLGEQPLPQQPAPAVEAPQGMSWLGDLKADLALTATSPGDDFAQQLARMAEMKNITMTVRDGGMSDVAPLASAGTQRVLTPAAASGEARPVTPAYVHLPLHDPQWQSEFSNRVTWLAKAGGNQVAEIRLNPANLGPVEVRVVMKDDQATITFSAQHGVVRDAIESSLPRLREMFSGSGMQLAQASVADQPLQDQRQRQQQGFGSGQGRSETWYGESDESGELVSPLLLSSTRGAMLADSLDLYV